jgi:photosystem II stability/assembly factor-like uncharacterized protein
MKKRFLPLSMLLITMVLAQASLVANAAEIQGKYTPRNGSNATFSSFMKSIRANQETGLIDPALLIAGQKAAQMSKDNTMTWEEAGPDNLGGPSRAVIYDNDGNVLIGSMAGDIYKTTNGGVTFKRIAHVGAPVSCFAKVGNEIYIGTGDGFDAHNLNGLSDLGYETSFVGNGVFKMEGNTTVQVSGTENIAFVNEMATVGNNIYAATSEGLLKNWSVVVAGNFRSVKANENGDVLAADQKDVYLALAGGSFEKITDTEALPSNDNPKIIAMSPSNKNFMYIAYLTGSVGEYQAGNLYFTADGGTTWEIGFAAPATPNNPLYAILGEDANHSGFIAVFPNNPRKLLVGSTNLWVLEDATSSGVNSYRPIQISEYNTSEYSAIAWNRYYYLHQGILNIVFDKNNANTFFIGTDGGIYKGEYYEGLYSYKGGNRYFITEDVHCSTSRIMSIGVGGITEVIGGDLDKGTVYMAESELINNVTTGEVVFPHPTNNGYASSYFTKDYAGGTCAISTIDPLIYFVSGTGALSTPIYRTQTAGDDFDGNFEGGGDDPVITNANAFKTPYVLFENYNDANNPVDTLYAPIRTTKYVGDLVYAYSLQAGYPVDYYITAADATHTDPEGRPCCLAGDTIRGIHDPISSLYLCGVEGKLYMTRDALIFNKATEWIKMTTLTGIPSAIAISGDGDVALVGTVEGNLYRVSGLSHAYTPAQACVDSTACVVTFDVLTGFAGQAVTGISINPANSNDVLVSLGNYGNNAYVYKSTDGGYAFTSVQGNLPKVPAYSCLIEKSTGLLIAGTEHGIYTSADGNTWTKSGELTCPVMDLKQASQPNHDTKIDILYDEMGNQTYVIYPGVFNEGMIYAGTYGAGIMKCSTYKEGSDLGVDEIVTENNIQVNVYPNPVRGTAQFSFTMAENGNVSYQVYDLAGRMMVSNNLGFYTEGEHTATFNAEDLATGTYIIRVMAGNKTNTAKFLVY